MGERRFLPEEELNRYWNDLVADGRPVAVAPGSLDPAAAETMRWLARLGATPAPAASRERVQRGVRKRLRLDAARHADWRDPTQPAPMGPRYGRHRLPTVDLVVHGTIGADRAPSSAVPSNGRVRHADISANERISDTLAPPRTALRHPLAAQARALTHITAAMILIVAIASAMVALLYPHRPWVVGERPSLSGSDTTVVEPALTGETTLLDLMLADIPPYRAQLGMFILTLPPATQTELHSGSGPQLFYVAEGPVTVRARTAPEPLEVIPPASAGERPPTALIAQEEQATMETGAALLVPGGAVINLFTPGSTAGRVVDLLAATDSRAQGHGVNVQFPSNGSMTIDLAAPVAIALLQGSLAPEATIVAPTSDATRQVVATLQAAAISDLRTGPGGAVRNAGEQPVEMYVLTVTSGDVAVAQDESE